MGDATEPGYSEGNNIGTSAETMGDADRPKRVESKVDITTQDKTNKTSILVSY